MKAIFVFRRITAANGTSILHPIGLAADEVIAKKLTEHATGFVNEIAQGRVVVNTPEGPRQVMTVAQLFAELGLAGIDTVTMAGEVKDTTLVVPRKLVSLQ